MSGTSRNMSVWMPQTKEETTHHFRSSQSRPLSRRPWGWSPSSLAYRSWPRPRTAPTPWAPSCRSLRGRNRLSATCLPWHPANDPRSRLHHCRRAPGMSPSADPFSLPPWPIRTQAHDLAASSQTSGHIAESTPSPQRRTEKHRKESKQKEGGGWKCLQGLHLAPTVDPWPEPDCKKKTKQQRRQKKMEK